MLSFTKSRLTVKTLFFIFIFILLSSFLSAVTINVPADQPTIQAGIDAAGNGDVVLVQPGTYVENINYNGKNITVASLFYTTADTTYISSTIIDGNSSGKVVIFENSEDSTAVLCGFTITNGFASGSSPANCGGGIYCDSSSPSLENVTITGNFATYSGGGIYCYWHSSPSLDNITITGNSVSGHGAGIYCNYFSSPSLQNVTISGNFAGYGGGGGIYCFDNSSPSLNNVTITGNSASESGGGIHCYYSCNPSLQNVTISGNSVSGYGGGIYCNGSGSILTNSISWNNSPQEIYIYSGSVTATYSDIQGEWIGLGNIDSDPLFVDPGNGDYHLQSISPCINTGDPSSPLDPDGTRADMGAFYFHQIKIAANFTSNTNNGYSPLLVNFTDLSTPGAGVIDEWYWDFGDGESSSVQNPNHTFYELGYYTISLTVTDENDSTDTEIKTDYIAVSANEQPASPANVDINILGNDVELSWNEVNSSIYGNFLLTDYYLIYNSLDPYSNFSFHGLTTDTTYIHQSVSQFSNKMFYKVTSYVGGLDLLQDVIAKHPDFKLGELDLLIEEKRLRVNKSFRYLDRK